MKISCGGACAASRARLLRHGRTEYQQRRTNCAVEAQWHSRGDVLERRIKFVKLYLKNECVDLLKKFTSQCRDTLERKVHPETSLFWKHSSPPEVVCDATGFFPKALLISWQKDGEDVYEDVELRETLPNQDGSFQKRSILKVSAEELQKHTYTCVIEHSSLEKDLVLPVSERRILRDGGSGGGQIGIIIICVVVALAVLVVAGIFIWKKKQSGFKSVPARAYQFESHWSNLDRYKQAIEQLLTKYHTVVEERDELQTRYKDLHKQDQWNKHWIMDIHSLQYRYTTLTPGTQFPEFTVVGLVDGEQFVYYDSNIRKMIPKTEWMKRIEGIIPYYWEKQTQAMWRDQENLKLLLDTIRPKASLSLYPAVVCHATGFFPKAVRISWWKNGKDMDKNVELRKTLPNQDGTFQKRSILKVPVEELLNHNYSCVIQHSSLEKDIVLPVEDFWNAAFYEGPSKYSCVAPIAPVAISVLVAFVCSFAGFVI
ncbi:hypothetical protein HF521_014934 [Silurus meridionalis]|uniref:Ig-like domain-containing protein n=1 Tax=Silurus meridionalis TaxID=175797 RepID=A0A8T0A9V8_SILME|nr:hypothetical protein HF521_014934 [Silurus meridionalis]